MSHAGEGSGGAIQEHHLTVERTARYWTAGGSVSPDEVWFVLHGYAQLAGRFVRRFASIAGDARRIVAPEGLSRFYVERAPGRHGPRSLVGATWMTREDRSAEIEDYVRYLDRLADEILSTCAHPPRVTVLGFSQGVATAARWVSFGDVQAERAILWGDTMPPDLDLASVRSAWAGTQLVLVRGDADRSVEAARAAAEAESLERAGISFEVRSYAGGHEIEATVLASLTG